MTGESPEARGASGAGAGVRSTVLVVDDEKGFARMLATLLCERGFAAVAVFDGDGAVEHLHECRVDAVLCDVVMPGLAGTALLRAVRALPGNGDLPVVFMSSLPEQRVRTMVEGRYAYLAKPFMIDRVVAALVSALHQAVLHRAHRAG